MTSRRAVSIYTPNVNISESSPKCLPKLFGLVLLVCLYFHPRVSTALTELYCHHYDQSCIVFATEAMWGVCFNVSICSLGTANLARLGKL